MQPADLLAAEAELELAGRRPAAQQHAVDQGIDHLLGVGRHRHGNAQALADRARLAQQDVQNDEVDLIVGAVEEDGADLGSLLAVAVDPALALLQAVRVPGQVVVEHGVEMVLEVDPLRQAIGGD